MERVCRVVVGTGPSGNVGSPQEPIKATNAEITKNGDLVITLNGALTAAYAAGYWKSFAMVAKEEG